MSSVIEQKGGDITGGLVSDEFLDSSTSVLDKNFAGGNTKGAQQWYTPESAAQLVARVIGPDTIVLDPTAGNGSLLKFFGTPNSFGVEVDPDQIENAQGSYHAIQGDIQHVYTLLRQTQSFDAVVMNPPFSLKWSEPSLTEGAEVNSVLLTLMMGLRLLNDGGQFVLIDSKSHFEKSIKFKPEAAGIYAVIECPDLFPGTTVNNVIAFGVHPDERKNVSHYNEQDQYVTEDTTGYESRECPEGMLDLCADWVLDLRTKATQRPRFRYHSHHAYQIVEQFKTLQKEHDRRLKERQGEEENREYDVRLFGTGGTNLDVKLTAFNRLALAKIGKLHEITRLDGSALNYFIQNERDWNALARFAKDGLITIDPVVTEKIDAILHDRRRVLCPLYQVSEVQRLGFLTDVESLRCKKSFDGFDAGVHYDLNTRQIVIKTTEQRPYQVQSGKRKGEWEMRTYEDFRAVMQISIGGGKLKLTDSERDSEQIKHLIDHFELPDPGDVGTRFPEETEAMRQLLREIEEDTLVPNSTAWRDANPKAPNNDIVRLKTFQREDLARLLVKNDGMIAWEQGLGKTIAGITFALAHQRRGCKEQVLIVAPKDLIPQWQRELQRLYGKKITLVKTQAQAKKIAHDLKRGKSGWFITYPTALAVNGTRKSKPGAVEVVKEWEEDVLVKGTDTYGCWEIGEDGEKVRCSNDRYYTAIDKRKQGLIGYGHIPARYKRVTKQLTSKEICPACHSDRLKGWNGTYCEAVQKDGSVCGYAHFSVKVKPVASFLSSAFKNGIVILDEATMIGGAANGTDSKQSKAIRGIRAKRKLAMTGTPIRNYVNQAFWPFWWSLGNESPRFGYGYDDRSKFEDNFCVVELTRGRDGKQKSRKVKPEITNLSKFWRMTASSLIRRRKEDTGEPIVPRYFFPVDVPLGKAQQQQLNKWAKCFPAFFIETHPDSDVVVKGGPEIVAMMAPMLGLQQKFEYAELLPAADPHVDWKPDQATDPLAQWQDIEVSNFTPATLKVLELAMALVKNGEQVLIGSPLKLTSRFIAESLAEKGVNAAHVLDSEDNTADPDSRAEIVYDFQTGQMQVLCAGVQSIRFGHNLDSASAVILLGFPWDFETMDQFIARIHRLTSKKPVSVYQVVVGTGTVTEKKLKLLNLKGDASSLALDGHIVKKQEFEIDKAAVIRELMEKGVHAQGDEVAEADVEQAWADFPHIDEYEPPEGILGTPPAQLPLLASEVNRDLLVELGEKVAEKSRLAAIVDARSRAFGEAKQREAAAAAIGEFFTKGAENLLEQERAADAVGQFLRALAPKDEPEAEVADATKDSAPPSDDLKAVLAQMAEMKALIEQQAAQIEALKQPQQMSLLDGMEEAA